MYQFNLLVSHRLNESVEAQNEIRSLLNLMGDQSPSIVRTPIKGIIGVQTSIDSRQVTAQLKTLFTEKPEKIHFAIKWVPVDNWSSSEIDSMVNAVSKVKDQIEPDDTWSMDIEKRRYPQLKTYDILTRLAEQITVKVDLKKPTKILRVDIMGDQAGISVLKPEEIFSTAQGRKP